MGIGSEMGFHGMTINVSGEEDMDLRRGPWTVEEDLLLINNIAIHGEGRWNSLARCSGLKRTGKSCRLRWLNYLRPDVRRGNITPEEQLIILELHSRWGNRWSKIAQHLPGRTDNEIKNYWRTRVQKQAKQLKCDVNSKQFKDAMRYLWMPRLMERITAAATAAGDDVSAAAISTTVDVTPSQPWESIIRDFEHLKTSPDSSSFAGTSESESSAGNYLSSDLREGYGVNYGGGGGFINHFPIGEATDFSQSQGFTGFESYNNLGEFLPENLWAAEDIWPL